MLTSIRGLAAASLFTLCALAATPALADEGEPEAPAEFTFSGYATGVSDYRWRGLSYSGGDFAVQGSINVNHASGFYVGTWASSLEQDLFDVYGSAEVDLYAGWSGEVASGVTADVGVTYYVYPNGSVGDANFFEPYASLSTTVGPVSAKFGVNYAWEQDSLASDDNLYVFTDLGYAIGDTGLGLNAHLGYTDGVLSPKSLTGAGSGGGFDYSVGASYNVTEKLSVGISYVGADGASINDFSDDAVVGSIKLAF